MVNLSGETILSEFMDERGENPVAQWRLTEGAHGLLATYVELSPEAEQMLRHDNWAKHPGGREFYGHRVAAIQAQDFAAHRHLGRFAKQLGYSYSKYSGQGVVRKATLPIADSLNAALDTMKHMKGRFRFYDPYTTTGHAPGAQFVGGVSLGLAPFAGPMTGRFFHDAADHPFGYIFIDAMDVGCIRERGHGLLSTGLELTDPDGTLDKASEGSAFAGAVDQLSSYLNRPVRFGDKPFSAAIDVAADFGAIHHGEERKLVNTTISTPFRTVMQLTPSGLGGALRAIHNQYREYS